MKTAISLPDELFVTANEFARTVKMSRSELYAAALREYIANHAKANLVERINAAYEHIDSNLPDDLAIVARKKLLEAEW